VNWQRNLAEIRQQCRSFLVDFSMQPEAVKRWAYISDIFILRIISRTIYRTLLRIYYLGQFTVPLHPATIQAEQTDIVKAPIQLIHYTVLLVLLRLVTVD
jgi:hypothetical protein